MFLKLTSQTLSRLRGREGEGRGVAACHTSNNIANVTAAWPSPRPSPASGRGRKRRGRPHPFSRRVFAPELCQRHDQEHAPGPIASRLVPAVEPAPGSIGHGVRKARPKNPGIADAGGQHRKRLGPAALTPTLSRKRERRENIKRKNKGSGTPKDAYADDRATRTDVAVRPRCGRGARHGPIRLRGVPASGALASRRSTPALAAATERRRSASVRALPGTEPRRNGRYPLPAASSAAPPVFVSTSVAGGGGADRSYCRPGALTRSRPGARLTRLRPRETVPAPTVRCRRPASFASGILAIYAARRGCQALFQGDVSA
jgi:hypothetical protein